VIRRRIRTVSQVLSTVSSYLSHLIFPSFLSLPISLAPQDRDI